MNTSLANPPSARTRAEITRCFSASATSKAGCASVSIPATGIQSFDPTTSDLLYTCPSNHQACNTVRNSHNPCLTWSPVSLSVDDPLDSFGGTIRDSCVTHTPVNGTPCSRAAFLALFRRLLFKKVPSSTTVNPVSFTIDTASLDTDTPVITTISLKQHHCTSPVHVRVHSLSGLVGVHGIHDGFGW
jgi:hypothetical protein